MLTRSASRWMNNNKKYFIRVCQKRYTLPKEQDRIYYQVILSWEKSEETWQRRLGETCSHDQVFKVGGEASTNTKCQPLQFWRIGCTGETSDYCSTRSSKIIVLEYKNQRTQIFGKLCYKKWVGEEEAAQAGQWISWERLRREKVKGFNCSCTTLQWDRCVCQVRRWKYLHY